MQLKNASCSTRVYSVLLAMDGCLRDLLERSISKSRSDPQG
jgi:hypothetical protein